jgi:peptide-methionine (R)-S-oxide reductase
MARTPLLRRGAAHYMPSANEETRMTTATKSRSGYDIAPLSPARRAEYAQSLTPEERQVILDHGTERPFCGTLLNNKAGGVYACRLCGLPLFKSEGKFESGTGWPSFNDPLPDAVETSSDRSYGMVRNEVHCTRCGSHLGHVFDDGPPPTHLRYCINGVAMNFMPE